MEQMYSVMLIIVGFILTFKFLKESRIFILAGAYFVFLGAWRIADSILPADLFSGGYNVLVQVVTGVVLAAMAAYFGWRYWHEYKKSKANLIEAEAEEIDPKTTGNSEDSGDR